MPSGKGRQVRSPSWPCSGPGEAALSVSIETQSEVGTSLREAPSPGLLRGPTYRVLCPWPQWKDSMEIPPPPCGVRQSS